MSAAAVLRCVLAGALLATAAAADEPENVLPVSKGVYRLPFEDGVEAFVGGSHVTHSPHNRLDISSLDNADFTNNVVAAGDGWIEYVQDSNTVTCPTAGCDGYSGPSGLSNCCLRGTQGCDTCSAGLPGCQITCFNNYVFLRHLNGEWTKYSHFQTGSVVANGWSVGDWIDAGQVLGLEGDVGFAGGVHVHFEVGVPDAIAATPPGPGDPSYDPLGINPANCQVCGFPNGSDDDSVMLPGSNAIRQNRIPRFCDENQFPLVTGQIYTAGPCDGQCMHGQGSFLGIVQDDQVYYRQASDTLTTLESIPFGVQAGAGASVRAGTRVTLGPGFTAETGSYFSAAIGACDRPGF